MSRALVKQNVKTLENFRGADYVEKVTQKMSFLYTAGAKYVSFDNQTLNPEAFVPSLTKSIAISHFFA